MYQYSIDDQSGVLHLTQAGRSTLEDFQEVMPDLLHCLQSGKYPKFLLEIQDLDEPEGYADPDLAFGALNEIKVWISRMAIVCPEELVEFVEPVAEIVRNYRKPVKRFSQASEALRWLNQMD